MREAQIISIVDFTALKLISGEEPSPLPPSRTIEMDIRDAKRFRQEITERMHSAVCACCSRYRQKREVRPYSYNDVEGLHLLAVTLPSTEAAPRDALTTHAGYCLQPAACRPDGYDMIIDLCDECVKQLALGRVPDCSLVNVDTGSIPSSPVPELNLAPLAVNEECLVARIRVIRCLFTFYPDADGRSVRQYSFRGNVIAFPNAPISDVVEAIPMPLSRIPEIMQVIFVTQCSTEEDMDKVFAAAKPLKIRGQEVAKWAVHLTKVSLHQ